MNNKTKNIYGISEKQDGNMRLFRENDGRVKNNRSKFIKKFGLGINNIVSAGLANDNKVAVVKNSDRGKTIINTDALITEEKNLVLTITVADCLPIYFYAQDRNVIAIAHAGWRGLEKNIISQTMALMKKRFNIKIDSLKVWLGPHISWRHYEVKDDVINKFKKYGQALSVKNSKKYLDLGQVAVNQLKTSGVPGGNIKISRQCTYQLKNKFFSYRREGNKNFQAVLAFIMQK